MKLPCRSFKLTSAVDVLDGLFAMRSGPFVTKICMLVADDRDSVSVIEWGRIGRCSVDSPSLVFLAKVPRNGETGTAVIPESVLIRLSFDANVGEAGSLNGFALKQSSAAVS